MPANKKYLASNGQRALKIIAGVLFGYILSMMVHNFLGAVIPNKAVIVMTTAYSSFFVWVLFMILAFLAKNGWKILVIYMVTSAILAALIFILR
jgi:hypothetical protein